MREADQRPNAEAVRWWFATKIDGTPFTRGGRVATARLARRALEHAWEEAKREEKRIAELKVKQHWLMPDGSLKPIPR